MGEPRWREEKAGLDWAWTPAPVGLCTSWPSLHRGTLRGVGSQVSLGYQDACGLLCPMPGLSQLLGTGSWGRPKLKAQLVRQKALMTGHYRSLLKVKDSNV